VLYFGQPIQFLHITLVGLQLSGKMSQADLSTLVIGYLGEPLFPPSFVTSFGSSTQSSFYAWNAGKHLYFFLRLNWNKPAVECQPLCRPFFGDE
jgi:hypothetical protein